MSTAPSPFAYPQLSETSSAALEIDGVPEGLAKRAQSNPSLRALIRTVQTMETDQLRKSHGYVKDIKIPTAAPKSFPKLHPVSYQHKDCKATNLRMLQHQSSIRNLLCQDTRRITRTHHTALTSQPFGTQIIQALESVPIFTVFNTH